MSITYLHLSDFSAAEICQQEHSHPCVLAGVLLALTLTALWILPQSHCCLWGNLERCWRKKTKTSFSGKYNGVCPCLVRKTAYRWICIYCPGAGDAEFVVHRRCGVVHVETRRKHRRRARRRGWPDREESQGTVAFNHRLYFDLTLSHRLNGHLSGWAWISRFFELRIMGVVVTTSAVRRAKLPSDHLSTLLVIIIRGFYLQRWPTANVMKCTATD